MANPIIRYAKVADVWEMYSQRHPRSMKAIVAELDGRVIGIGGYYIEGNGLAYAFARITDELKKYPVTLFKAGLKIREMLQKANIRVLAVADKDKEASGRFLDHLGYIRVGTSNEGDIYEWTPLRTLT